MSYRFSAFALVVLLLSAQFASVAMQLCVEDDGQVNLELAGIDCGVANPIFSSSNGTSQELDGSPTVAASWVTEEQCPCLDFGVGVTLQICRNLDAVAVHQLNLLPLELPVALLSPVDFNLTVTAHDLGKPTRPWLECSNALAENRAAFAVVMRC